jgi:hypothetical protein
MSKVVTCRVVAARFILVVLAVAIFHFMLQLITILNRCHRFPGFVYQQARFSSDRNSIEIAVRPRKGSAAVCSRCHQPAPGYDQLSERRFEFIPFWGFLVFLLYSMRRVDCRRCQAVVVEEVPWGDGKRTLTRAYMLFLARWARRLSWKETAEAFRTSWELTGQSFLIPAGGRPKVPIKCELISKEVNWKRKGLHLPAVGCEAGRLRFAGPLATQLSVVIKLAGQLGKGFRRCGTRRHLWTGTSHAGSDRRYRGR